MRIWKQLEQEALRDVGREPHEERGPVPAAAGFLCFAQNPIAAKTCKRFPRPCTLCSHGNFCKILLGTGRFLPAVSINTSERRLWKHIRHCRGSGSCFSLDAQPQTNVFSNKLSITETFCLNREEARGRHNSLLTTGSKGSPRVGRA